MKSHNINKYHLSFADWSVAELAEGLRCIFTGNVINGKNFGRLTFELSKIYTPSTVYTVNYGRSAINIALIVFSRIRPHRKDVVVPVYICPSVVEIVRASGFNPILVDVGDDLNVSLVALASVLTCNTLAVIVPHMYGCPAKIDEIENLCKRASVFLIDDAAQVIGIRHQGRTLGTFGDIGIISFAQSKSVVTGIGGSGGAILVNNPELDEIIRSNWLDLPPASHRTGMFFNFVWNCLWGCHTGNSGYYFTRIKEFIGFKKKSDRVYSHISNLDAGIAVIQIKRMEIIKKKKIDSVEAYHCALKNFKEIRFPQYAPGIFLARVMIELPMSVDLEIIRLKLKNMGVSTRLGYDAYATPALDKNSAEVWSRRLLEVPSGKNIGYSEAFDICTMIKVAIDASDSP